MNVKKSILTSLAMVAAWYMVTLPLCHTFETNDDALMNAISAGWLDGNVSPEIPFMHFGLGHLLSWLYTISSDFNWYAIGAIGTQAIASIAITFVALCYVRPLPISLLLLAFYFFMCLGPNQLLLQFTTTSFLISAAGTVLVIAAIWNDKSHLPNWQVLLGIACITLGMLIRFKMPFMLFLVLGPLWLYLFYVKFGLALPKILGSILVIGILVYASDAIYHKNDSYYHYNKVRGELHDNPQFNYEPNKEALQHIGWTVNDLLQFKYFVMLDESKMSYTNLKYINDHIALQRLPLEGYINILTTMAANNLYLVAVWVLITLWLLYCLKDTKAALVVAGMWMVIIILLYLLYNIAVIKNRVLLPMIQISTLVMFAFFIRKNIQLNTISKVVTILFAGIIMGLSAYQMLETSRQNRKSIAANQAHLQWQIQQQTNNTVYLPLITAIDFHHVNIWKTDKLGAENLRFVPNGWLFNSPVYQYSKAKYGLGDIPNDLLQNEGFYFMLSDDFLLILDLIKTYYAENMAIEVQITDVGSYQREHDVVRIYQIRKATI